MIAHDAKLEISKRKKPTIFKHVYTIMVKISHSKSSLNFKVWVYRILSNVQSCDTEMFILISSKDVSFMMFMCKTKHWTKTMSIEMSKIFVCPRKDENQRVFSKLLLNCQIWPFISHLFQLLFEPFLSTWFICMPSIHHQSFRINGA